jgi:hypothetical protein
MKINMQNNISEADLATIQCCILGRWELALADNVYIQNRINIGAQTYNGSIPVQLADSQIADI